VNLLEHVVVVAALGGLLGVPLDARDRLVQQAVLGVRDGPRPGFEAGELAVVEIHHAVGVLQEGGHVAGEVGRVVADADDQRRVPAGGEDGLRVLRDRGQRVTALQSADRRAEGRLEARAVGAALLDEVRHDFGVGVAVELVAAVGEFGPQLVVVLDDAVVDDRHLARAVGVRVGVRVAGRAVGAPAGVADADRPVEAAVHGLLQVVEFALALADREVAVRERDPRRVVAPVFEAFEAREEHVEGIAVVSGVPDDAAHVSGTPRRAL
jgi:hypothetical protein